LGKETDRWSDADDICKRGLLSPMPHQPYCWWVTSQTDTRSPHTAPERYFVDLLRGHCSCKDMTTCFGVTACKHLWAARMTAEELFRGLKLPFDYRAVASTFWEAYERTRDADVRRGSTPTNVGTRAGRGARPGIASPAVDASARTSRGQTRKRNMREKHKGQARKRARRGRLSLRDKAKKMRASATQSFK